MEIMAAQNDALNHLITLKSKMHSLTHKALSHNKFEVLDQVLELNKELIINLKSLLKFDFVSMIEKDKCLFIGEGNLSFSACLAKQSSAIEDCISTTYESFHNLPNNTLRNICYLIQAGAKVLHNVDATKLTNHFPNQIFDSIIFQFPHSGMQENGKNSHPNFTLLGGFLKESGNLISNHGKIIITIVDNAFYHAIFRIHEAATLGGLDVVKKYIFDLEDYPTYKHVNTNNHNQESALESHEKFVTYIFKKKGC